MLRLNQRANGQALQLVAHKEPVRGCAWCEVLIGGMAGCSKKTIRGLDRAIGLRAACGDVWEFDDVIVRVIKVRHLAGKRCLRCLGRCLREKCS